MISKEDVERVAHLARIQLTEKEVEKFQHDLADILEYFEVLKDIDVASVEPMMHSIDLKNVLREDVAKEKNLETTKKIMNQVPEQQDGYIKVKQILQDGS